MSVTFHVDTTPTGSFEVHCGCRYDSGEAQGTFASYEAADAWMGTYRAAPYPLPGCSDDTCLAYLPMIQPVFEHADAPSVNMANGNAVEVLRALGLVEVETGEVDFCGALPAEDFLGRILLALALEPISAERPSMQMLGEGNGATVVLSGRREGYMQERLADLRSVAAYAQERGLDVIWC